MTSSTSSTSCCFLCRKSSSLNCADCGEIGACTPDHLSVHRGTRDVGRGKCLPFRIETRSGVGNVMVAVRHIKASETILEEYPAVWGPKNKSLPVCLQCLKPCVTKKADESEDSNAKPNIDGSMCSLCGYPVCDEKCELAKCVHTTAYPLHPILILVPSTLIL